LKNGVNNGLSNKSNEKERKVLVILINATAAKTSGALTILKDCIAYIEQNIVPDKKYHLFTVLNDFNEMKNIQIHKLEPQSWISRIRWDNGGLWRWCQSNNLEPDIIVSLQNTSTKYKTKNGLAMTQVVYYHQTLPLNQLNGLYYGFKSMLKYYFYSFFVNRNNAKSYYVVQLPYVKKLFCKKFKNISPVRVEVIRPNIPQIDVTSIANKNIILDKNTFKFLYPATQTSYKNHKILISALKKLKKSNPEILDKIIIFFTVAKLSNSLMNNIKLNNLGSCIRFLGQLQYKDLLFYYKSVDALIFPSKIESFGLPLLEASFFGLPIIVCDLPYSREVLEEYTNKYFIDSNNIEGWANAIYNFNNYYKITTSNKLIAQKNSWKSFFELVDKLIYE